MSDIVIDLSRPQADLMTATARYLDGEGAIRSGKSYVAAEMLANRCIEHPGIHCLASRWSEQDLDAQVKPLWRETAERFGLTLLWHADEQYDEVVGYGSRVYLRGLKAGEQTSRYAKFRGLTLAWIWVDQAEEVPEDVYLELKGRLSQPGFPQQLLITPNPPGEDHWIAKEFPEDNPRPQYHYIRFSLEDNRHNLGDDTADAIKAAYPEGTAMRRRLIDGRRGLAAVGEPVYKGAFSRDLHVRPVEMIRDYPLLEGWDYGHGHPCVIWEQRLPWGETRVLGGVMAVDMFLPEFAAIALQYRAEWCANPLEVRSTGDPAGEAQSNQGAPLRAVDLLRQAGISVAPAVNGNHPERRNYAIQQTAAGMLRRTSVGQAFSINPRFALVTKQGIKTTSVLVDGFEAGYVWDARSIANTASPNTRRPKKDGFYDHSQNCHEYIELTYGVSQPTQKQTQKDERAALKRLQFDVDPDDRRLAHARRGGY